MNTALFTFLCISIGVHCAWMKKTENDPTPPKCLDIKGYFCGDMANMGYCATESKFHSWMRKNCCKSCKGWKPPVGPTKAIGCVDRHYYCANWAKLGYCNKESEFRYFMEKTCCKTCRETKPATKSPTPAGPTKPGGCVDKDDYCPTWEKLGYCSVDSEYHGFMEKTCCKTCNERKPATKIPTPVVPTKPAGCVDKDDYCPKWATLGYCSVDSEYHGFMMKTCCKTCQELKPTTSKAIPTKPPTKPTTAIPIPTKPSACVDKDDYCGNWAKLGYCSSKSKYHGFMEKTCCKTCQELKPATTSVPIPTKPPTKPTTTSVPIPTKPPACVDKDDYCSSWEKLGYCSSKSKYHGFMEKTCCKTCQGEAKPTTKQPTKAPVIPTKPSGPSCDDKDKKCEYWASFGYCRDISSALGYMKKNCCKTCKSKVSHFVCIC